MCIGYIENIEFGSPLGMHFVVGSRNLKVIFLGGWGQMIA
jgi:hypothetical protein